MTELDKFFDDITQRDKDLLKSLDVSLLLPPAYYIHSPLILRLLANSCANGPEELLERLGTQGSISLR